MGLLVFILSIAVFIPIFIFSKYLYLQSRKAEKIESAQLAETRANPAHVKIILFSVYAICLMLAHHEYWLKLVMHFWRAQSVNLGLMRDYGSSSFDVIREISYAVLGWDNWYHIFYYWEALLITYTILTSILFILYKIYNIRLFQNNNYVGSLYNIALYPLMVVSFINWAFKITYH